MHHSEEWDVGASLMSSLGTIVSSPATHLVSSAYAHVVDRSTHSLSLNTEAHLAEGRNWSRPWSMKASSSVPSISLGPGLLKNAEASVQNTFALADSRFHSAV